LSAADNEPDHQAIIGIGSNISPSENLRSALYLLSHLVSIEAVAEIWKTRSIGSPGPDFLNTAVLISTGYSDVQLRNEVLRPIENLLGRERTQDPNAPRTIDLDILIFDGEQFDEQLWLYAHTAVPVAELVPEFIDPKTGNQAAEISEALSQSSGIEKTALNLHWTRTT
jgi:2-amino-4-hydroxy-6-hydroxymethyldihydropteridine diphosphokinase